jgi:hypothetical protein
VLDPRQQTDAVSTPSAHGGAAGIPSLCRMSRQPPRTRVPARVRLRSPTFPACRRLRREEHAPDMPPHHRSLLGARILPLSRAGYISTPRSARSVQFDDGRLPSGAKTLRRRRSWALAISAFARSRPCQVALGCGRPGPRGPSSRHATPVPLPWAFAGEFG